jgi:hypothetical protein
MEEEDNSNSQRKRWETSCALYELWYNAMNTRKTKEREVVEVKKKKRRGALRGSGQERGRKVKCGIGLDCGSGGVMTTDKNNVQK